MTQTTTGRPAIEEMVVVHRMFRREFGLGPAMVRVVPPGDTVRAGLVARHLTELSVALHHHHTGEDELVWPRLRARADVAGDLVQRMEAQHARVGALLHRLEVLLPVWGTSADADDRDELSGVLEQLSPALDEHLAEEEREILPLVERHLTAEEWNELGERGSNSLPKSRMLVVFGYLLEDATPQERRMMLGVLPAPVRVLYGLLGRRKYEKERDALRQGLTIPHQRRG